MIISNRHKFIFLHSRKTAGSSITAALARLCSEEDIICGPVDDVLKENIIPPSFEAISKDISLGKLMLKIIRNAHRRKGGISYPLLGPTADRWRRHYRRYMSRTVGLHDAHTSAGEIIEFIGRERWDSFFKFAFERNPWDRMISFYYWRMRHFKDKKPTFADFIRAIDLGDEDSLRAVRADDWSNQSIYTVSGQLEVDALCRYEDLQNDLSKVYETIGLSFDGWLPNAKGKLRTSTRPVEDYYTAELDGIIRRHFAVEIELLGYQGPGHSGRRSIIGAHPSKGA